MVSEEIEWPDDIVRPLAMNLDGRYMKPPNNLS